MQLILKKAVLTARDFTCPGRMSGRCGIRKKYCRNTEANLPEVSELDVVPDFSRFIAPQFLGKY